MICNQVVLCGRIIELGSLRYTPAGIPLLNCKISHASEQIEAGGKRQVQCEVNVVALDKMALALSRCKMGDSLRITGFLSRQGRMNTKLILHVNQLEHEFN